jgi:uncharacterized protein
MKIYFNKSVNINKIKIAITTACNLDCNYCFVNKTKETMNLNTAKKAVDLLLSSGKGDKLLSIYGGEPLLNFGLIEMICPYAQSQARKLSKNLIISICTNSTLLTKAHLDFFRKYNIRLIISVVGNKIFHDRFRRFNNKGTYEIIAKKLTLIFKSISPEYLGVSFCISPSLVNNLEENFGHLLNLGFKYINFEIIREYEQWTLDRIEKFASELKKVMKFILSEIPKKKFIFLNPINWEIKYRGLTKSLGINCPFNYKLEVYPIGEMTFSPFLLNSPQKENYIIGNINKSFFRFNNCRFNPKNNKCQRCEHDYFKDYNSDEGASKAYRLYGLLCLKMAKEIQNYAGKIKSFHDYVREINERVCF